MKKITVLLLLTLPIMTGFAQSAKLTNAINYLKDFRNNNDLESLQKAKENIDLIAQNPEAKEPAKVQKVKGEVYIALFESNLKKQTDKLANIADPTTRTLTAYKNTSANELDEAVKAFKAAKGADAKGIYALDISNGNAVILNHYFNKGNASFGDENNKTLSLQMYESASALDETNDTSLLNNLAASALYAKEYPKAIAAYTKMTEGKIGGAGSYTSIARICNEMKDSTKAFETAKKGRTLYPNDGGLLDIETNYYLHRGKSDEALKNLNQAITARPQEANLYLVRGGVYDKIARPDPDANGKTASPANFKELIKSAEADYKKGISIYETTYKPDAKGDDMDQQRISYYTNLFNLGILYFNNGADISKSADKITDNAKYAVENKKANEEFEKAIPYLEKAKTLKPDAETLRSIQLALRQTYTRLDMTAKLKTLNEESKN